MTSAEIYRALQRAARRDGRLTGEILTLYGLERVLGRLQRTSHRDDFILKGGVLLAAYALRRPTRDADMQALDFALDQEHLLAVLDQIAAVPADDGLTIDQSSAVVQQIRDEDEYSGLRLKFIAHIHTARLSLALDISTGDPVYPAPAPVTLPGLLGEDVHLLGHPAVMVVAEKTVTILQRGTQSTRWRDYVDLRKLARTRIFAAGEVRAALEAVAQHRLVDLEPITPLLAGYGDLSQPKWAAWRRGQDLEDACLLQLDDQIRAVASFLDPILGNVLASGATWKPSESRWTGQ